MKVDRRRRFVTLGILAFLLGAAIHWHQELFIECYRFSINRSWINEAMVDGTHVSGAISQSIQVRKVLPSDIHSLVPNYLRAEPEFRWEVVSFGEGYAIYSRTRQWVGTFDAIVQLSEDVDPKDTKFGRLGIKMTGPGGDSWIYVIGFHNHTQ